MGHLGLAYLLLNFTPVVQSVDNQLNGQLTGKHAKKLKQQQNT